MQDASQLATAHYPETLDRIFVSATVTLQSLVLAVERYEDFLTLIDHWRTFLFPYCMGLDQKMVRPYHDL